MRRAVRRGLVGAAALPLSAVLLLVAEVQVARRGSNLPDRAPYDVDATVTPPGGTDGAGVGGSPVRAVWLGDSTAAGVGASSAGGTLPRQVAQRLAGRLGRPVAVTGLAISGARVADVVEDQTASVARADPDVVAISIGSNDVTHLTSVGHFRRDYATLLDRLPDRVPVVMLGVPDLGAPPRLAQPLRSVAGVRGGTLDAVVRSLASERGAGYVDIAGETGPAFRRHPGRYFAADRYHPDDDGYRLWADAVVPVLAEAVG